MSDILDCGHNPSKHGAFTTGYSTDLEGKRHCYDCCAKNGRESMVRDGHSRGLPLYWSGGDEVTDWPGHLRFKLYPWRRVSRHNWGLLRTDFWFNGPDGFVWHGFQIGENTQIAHCRRTKERCK